MLLGIAFTPDNIVEVLQGLRPRMDQDYLLCTASCGAVMRDAMAKERWRPRGGGYEPVAGDLVLYCWNGSGAPEHVGRVISVSGVLTTGGVDATNSLTALEGNTSDASNTNGGAIAIRHRPVNSTIVGWIKLQN